MTRLYPRTRRPEILERLAGRRPEGTLHTPWEDGRPQARA